METTSIADLLLKHFIGELDEKGRRRLQEWLDQPPGHRRILDNLERPGWFTSEWKQLEKVDPKGAWEELRTRVACIPGVRPLPKLWERKRSVYRRLVWAMVLVVAILICIGLYLGYMARTLPH